MAKKNVENVEHVDTDMVAGNETEQPIKRLSEYTEEKKLARVNEELLSNVDVDKVFEVEAIIDGVTRVHGGASMFITIDVQTTEPGVYSWVITNSPAIIKKLEKVKRFPVLARFTRREVRGKFRYDLE